LKLQLPFLRLERNAVELSHHPRLLGYFGHEMCFKSLDIICVPFIA
jgi:hypothetical protein